MVRISCCRAASAFCARPAAESGSAPSVASEADFRPRRALSWSTRGTGEAAGPGRWTVRLLQRADAVVPEDALSEVIGRLADSTGYPPGLMVRRGGMEFGIS